MLHNSTGRDFTKALALKAKAFDQTLQGGGKHIHIAGIAVGGIAAHKRDTVSANNGNSAYFAHNIFPILVVVLIRQVLLL
jgi:hypothetical protein